MNNPQDPGGIPGTEVVDLHPSRRDLTSPNSAKQVRKRRQPEAQIQRALVERLAWQKPPGVWFCHIGNGGYRRLIEASIMAGLGVRRGAPDLIFIVAGRTFGLELKAPGGRLSQAQRESLARSGNGGPGSALPYILDQLAAEGGAS
jgi:hypothetical protein